MRSERPNQATAERFVTANAFRLEAAAERLTYLRHNTFVDDSVSVALKTVIDTATWLTTFTVYEPNTEETRTLIANFNDDQLSRIFSYADRIVELFSRYQDDNEIDPSVPRDETLKLLESMVSFLSELTDMFSESSAAAEALMSRYFDVATSMNAYTVWYRSVTALDKIEEAADSQAESAGEQSELSLSSEFDQLAKREGRTANVFRGLTIALFVIVIAYSAVVALTASAPSIEVAQRLGIGVPVLLLAGYFSREAGHHRKTARWSSILGAQLRSVRAYTVSMSTKEGQSLRLELGRRAFLQTPDSEQAASAGGAAESSALDPSVLREITDLVRAAQAKP